MQKLILCLAIICPMLLGAQPKPIAVGDTMPSFKFTNIINRPHQQICLQQQKGKLIILDFWATWCSSCIKGFNKLDTLSTLFPNKLFPILVNNTISTGDDVAKITSYLAARNSNKATVMKYPVAIETGPQLKQWFPRMYLPHYVWLYNNRVVAITSSAELTKENVQSILSGNPIPIKQKIDTVKRQPTELLQQGGAGGFRKNPLEMKKDSYEAFSFSPPIGGAGGGQNDFLSPN